MKKKTKKKLLQVLWFLVKLNLLAIPLYLLLYFNFSYQPLQDLVAFLSYKLLSALGVQASLNHSNLIATKGLKIAFVDVSMDCTGWKSLYALFALTIATPEIKLKKKSIFLAISLPSLFFINIARIVVTIYISLLEPEIFGFVHDILWSWGLVAAVLGIWLLWLKNEKRI
ncbi:MAG: archaeosortase/exosortase family protein [Candidatus Aenigmatarchaeota archaeon]